MTEIIYKNQKPYGIRDEGGYLLFFPKITKYPAQEKRYEREINEQHELATIINKAINQRKK